ncbi:MAG TPA: LysM peptidoglycan-binding domain-containing protein [Planctomycetota bacterium]|nr:LysM peptidoglycan-binding domain-containing protein [Planctomycetota bacterium]
MQRIERYGVIALVFLLVTILAVAVWGQRKNQSLLSIFKRDKTPEVAKIDGGPTGSALPTSGALGLSSPTHELTPGILQDPLPGTALAGPTDVTTILTPPAGPGIKAVTFEQSSPLIPQSGTTSSPLIADPPPSPGGFLTPAPIVAPIDNGARVYTVKPGDTLGSIAGRELGSTKRWKEIEALNGVKPERLKVGMEIKLPLGAASLEPQVLVKRDAPVADAPKVAKGTTYSVRSGDSLSRIAASQLGDANRYAEILALNPGLDPQRLSIGQSLRLPAGAKSVAAAPKPKSRPAAKSSEVAKAEAPKKARVQ